MRQKINQLFLVAALLCGAMSMSSCEELIDDILGEQVDNPTQPAPAPTPQPTPTPTPAAVVTATDLLQDAQKEGATVVYWYVHDNQLYRAIFKKVGDDYVLQNGATAGTRAIIPFGAPEPETIVTLVFEGGADVQTEDGNTTHVSAGHIATVTDKTGRGILQAQIDVATGSVVQAIAEKNTYMTGVAVAGSAGLSEDVMASAEAVFTGTANADDVNSLEKEGTHVLLVCTDDDGTLKVRSTGELSIAIVEEDGKTKVDVVNKATGTVVDYISGGSVIFTNPDFSVCKPTDCQVNPKTLELTVGDTRQLSATVIPTQCNQSVTWRSSNEKMATVDDKGVVTAVAVGVVLIHVVPISNIYTRSDRCIVTINAKTIAVTGVTLNKTSLDMKVGDSETLTATVAPEDATNKAVTWKSSNESVATVDDNGKVTTVGVGEATITATTTDGEKTAECKVTVKAATVAVTGVSLDQTSLDLTVGDSKTLKATVAPLDATNQNVTWESNNTAAATVDQNGAVKAVGVGEATITVTTEDGSKTATCTVKVSKKAGSISYPTAPVEKLTTDAAFTITLTKVGDGEVTYSSSDTDGKIVVVNSSSGEVTIKGAGEVKITATVRDSNTYHYATTTASYTLTVVKPNPAGGLEDYNKNNLNNW